MPEYDITDSRNEVLAGHINRILGSTETGHFMVGYFFLFYLRTYAFY